MNLCVLCGQPINVCAARTDRFDPSMAVAWPRVGFVHQGCVWDRHHEERRDRNE